VVVVVVVVVMQELQLEVLGVVLAAVLVVVLAHLLALLAIRHLHLHLKETTAVMDMMVLFQMIITLVAVEVVLEPLVAIQIQQETPVMAALERPHQLLEPQYQGLVVAVAGQLT
jgi:hypothetical protein